MELRITGLFTYPIKSCRGLALPQSLLENRGLRHDRCWMVVRAEDGAFLTQREFPQMALITPTVTEDSLVVEAPGMPFLAAPLLKTINAVPPKSVTVWGHTATASDQGDSAGRWFSDFFGFPCRLVHADDSYDRPLNPKFSLPGDRVGFADGYPVLLTSEASLADLNERITAAGGLPVGMERFRPNLVVTSTGLPPYAEDHWMTLSLRGDEGGATLRSAKPCARCAVTTIDQETAEARGPEPLKTLAAYRRSPDGKTLFGQNLIPNVEAERPVMLRVGDVLEAD
ncbi:MAG: MOSC N-terminal beta barrel domain-containing protein [Cytophagales bacterium]|nr:MOSC N-terminal beta barrel domain-containing protein [Armatimonadota bacterium]